MTLVAVVNAVSVRIELRRVRVFPIEPVADNVHVIRWSRLLQHRHERRDCELGVLVVDRHHDGHSQRVRSRRLTHTHIGI